VLNHPHKPVLIFGLSILTHLTTPAAYSGNRKAAAQLTVLVFNYAEVPPETLDLAQNTAARIFGRAGIETVWLDCSLSQEGNHTLPNCWQPAASLSLTLRLVPTSPASIAQFGDKTLGIAAQPEKGTPASASVFYDRVEKLARGGAASATVILGHAMAHELGHLLLGTNTHSPLGLMRAQWSWRDLEMANAGEFNFSQTQAALLRNQARRRAGNRNRNNN
jgi:hypothetical protein